ncbi:rCG36832 [Rattus norvegicus]|uniref:RCG36832 n=1 Tax=Rattus norvegicus TaxID=10116 RepID=A6HUD2_RAT|nr:rCG36832 [Rattus norvegicus]
MPTLSTKQNVTVMGDRDTHIGLQRWFSR